MSDDTYQQKYKLYHLDIRTLICTTNRLQQTAKSVTRGLRLLHSNIRERVIRGIIYNIEVLGSFVNNM